ncbi:cation diffusion facilitator family transporter [Pseudactinotalea suaedae]|uniref:cation diffusion facilitator family transporter n=1 Tax=Pseudactinotalea suaedae TaxID=1524924 RepID=UPI003F50A0B0
MGHDHGHDTPGQRHRGRLAAALAITCVVLVVEVVGAAVTGSLALLSDAGHMLTDAAGLTIALAATWLAARPADHRWTFGWQRAEVLAALVNGVLLTVVAVLVLVEGVQRWQQPPEVQAPGMLAIGVLGLLANLVALLLLRGGQRESINVRGAYLEVLGDLIGSIAVIAAAVVIVTTGWERADAVASIAIALLILPRAVSLLRTVAKVLLEGTPEDLTLADVRKHLEGVDGVVDVHDLHAWTITSGVPVLTAHVVVDDRVLTPDAFCHVLDAMQGCLRGHFDVEHSTFQIEPSTHDDHDEVATHA